MFAHPQMARRILSLCILVQIVPGCTNRNGIPVARNDPSSPGKPIRTAFMIGGSRLAEDRYLLLPIALAENHSKAYFGPLIISSSSSWSGMTLGDWSSWTVNIEIIDLRDKSHRRLFDQPTAVGSLELSFEPNPAGTYANTRQSAERLVFPGLLIAQARTCDTNGDRRIDSNDSVRLYSYELTTGTMQQISPEGYDVEHAQRLGQRILMVLEKETDRHEVAIYTYEPLSRQGGFAIQSLSAGS